MGLDQINGKKKENKKRKKKLKKNGMVKEEMVDNKPPRFFLQPAIKMSPHTVKFFFQGGKKKEISLYPP